MIFNDNNKINFTKLTDNVSVDFDKQMAVVNDKLICNYENYTFEINPLESELNKVYENGNDAIFIGVNNRNLHRIFTKKVTNNITTVYKVDSYTFIYNNKWYVTPYTFEFIDIRIIDSKYIVYNKWSNYHLIYKDREVKGKTINCYNNLTITNLFIILNNKAYKVNDSLLNMINKLNVKLLNYILKTHVIQKTESDIPF